MKTDINIFKTFEEFVAEDALKAGEESDIYVEPVKLDSACLFKQFNKYQFNTLVSLRTQGNRGRIQGTGEGMREGQQEQQQEQQEDRTTGQQVDRYLQKKAKKI